MIKFLSFDYQNQIIEDSLFKSLERTFRSKNYVLGDNVLEFESNYSKINKSKYSIGVGSGLDALIISLKALNVGKRDEVIIASNAYIASWLSISNVGATISPVEPDSETFNIDVNKIEEKITQKTKVIMPVHLFGQSCEMNKIMDIAKKHNLYVIEDNAQAHLAKYDSKNTGTFGKINATSFYPTKNLGAIGEAGCITTDDKDLRDFVFSYRNYGSSKKYVNDIIGTNSRLDEIQAGILNIKLKYLQKWNNDRKSIALKYNSFLSKCDDVKIPKKLNNCDHVYHLYVIQINKRDELQQYLTQNGIGTSIHYPIPPHLQKAYSGLKYKKEDFPIAEKLANTSLSLPIYPGLSNFDIEYICNTIIKFFKI
tara:strand:+ start:28014 stop:29117 length:1104 start_codon:yes stop_codon:yes gene_type:complete